MLNRLKWSPEVTPLGEFSFLFSTATLVFLGAYIIARHTIPITRDPSVSRRLTDWLILPYREDQFEVVAGDGTHEMLWVVDRTGLRVSLLAYILKIEQKILINRI